MTRNITSLNQKTKKRQVDWPAVERDYRASQMTLRELGEKYGCDHAAIARKAKRDGWERDLTDAVKKATNAKLIQAAVNSQVNKAITKGQHEVTKTVLAAAEVNTQVILGHRNGLKRITSVRDALLDQVEQAAMNLPDLEAVIEMVRSPDDNGVDRANDLLRKALSRSSLIDDLKRLAEVDEKVRKGEREAFGIDADLKNPDKGSSPLNSGLTDAERAVRLAALLEQTRKSPDAG